MLSVSDVHLFSGNMNSIYKQTENILKATYRFQSHKSVKRKISIFERISSRNYANNT
jgi:hypothetical protein